MTKLSSPNAAPVQVQVQQLDHLNLTVQNLEASLDFYRDFFGFSIVEEQREETIPWVIVRSGEAMLCLYEHPTVPQGPHYPDVPALQSMRHFALRVRNGAAFARLAEQQGLPLLFGGPVRWPHCTSYYVADPTGHQIEVVCWDDDTIRFDGSAA